jgi:hypothetical protein
MLRLGLMCGCGSPYLASLRCAVVRALDQHWSPSVKIVGVIDSKFPSDEKVGPQLLYLFFFAPFSCPKFNLCSRVQKVEIPGTESKTRYTREVRKGTYKWTCPRVASIQDTVLR